MEALFQQLPLLSLCMMRPLGMILLLPLFSGGPLGHGLLRGAIVLTLALPILPAMETMREPIANAGLWELLSLYSKEIFIGLLFSFCAAIPFWAIDISGYIIDTMRGASMATALNPLMGLQSSIYGILFTQVLTVLFLVSGGFNALITALYQSYQDLPPGFNLIWPPGFMAFLNTQWKLMSELAISFSMPAMLIMILTDVALGLVNRSAQQLNVFFLSMPIKSVLVLLFLLYSLSFSLMHYVSLMYGAELELNHLIKVMAGGH